LSLLLPLSFINYDILFYLNWFTCWLIWWSKHTFFGDHFATNILRW
jgi:hypothetical protein